MISESSDGAPLLLAIDVGLTNLKAVLFEGLRRLKRMGATMALVGGYSPAANALYGSLGTEQDLLEPWEKRL